MNSVTIVILTFNEEKHIERCLRSVFQVTRSVFVVDSFSNDRTREIALALGAQVWQHEFKHHAAQLQWALGSLPFNTEWVMRVDADEIISPALAKEICEKLSATSREINAYLVYRLIRFKGKVIRYGGISQWVLRLWRTGTADIEQRWMDEHMVLKSGYAETLKGEYYDDNLNGITWWTNKHNGYSTREAIDLLNKKYRFLPVSGDSGVLVKQARYIRWLKEHIYARLPLGVRAFLFFSYRMIFRLGILDGKSGFVFHFLQGFWYRFLVDVKVWEVENRMRSEGIDCVEAIRREFGGDTLL